VGGYVREDTRGVVKKSPQVLLGATGVIDQAGGRGVYPRVQSSE